MELKQNLVPTSKYSIKCPYEMTPEYITIHNTYNTASAVNEVNYMLSNDEKTSCHIFVDDTQAIQTIPFNRNAWHCGDGGNGTGNRKSIGVEICYSLDYETNKHELSYLNAVEVVKSLMEQFNIPIENVVQHNHWSGKDCPHRIREEGTWEKFLLLCKGVNEMELKNGYQCLTWLKQKIHVYKMSESEKISLYALPTGKTQDISKVEIDGKKLKCITNASYFDMVGGTNDILGRYQGINCDNATIGKGENGFTGYNGTSDKSYTDLVILSDEKTIKYGDFNSWDYRGDSVVLGVAPAGVQLHDGKSVNWYSPACTYSKITTANTQTLLLQCKDGSFALAVVEGKLSPLECRNFAIAYGCTHQSCYDSGGSSQMIVNGSKKLYTGRKLPDFFVIYEDENNAENGSNEATEEINEETTNETRKIYMTVDSVGVRIRDKFSFSNGKANGTVLKTLKVGEKLEVVEFVKGIQADNYQWVKAKSGNIVGYAQYDSQCYWLSQE